MLYLLIVGPILAGVLTILFHDKDTRLLTILIQTALFLYALHIFIEVRANDTISNYMSRVPKGLAITLMADTLSSVFILLTATIFLMMMIYAYHKVYFTLSEILLFVMGLSVFVSGVFGPMSIALLFGYETEIFTAGYFDKGIVFVLMLIAGTGLYNGVVKQSGVLDNISHLELTFNGILTSMTGYFLFIVGYLYLMI